MAQGYLRPQPGPNEQGLSAYGNPVNQGDVVSFTVTITESNPNEAEIYCDAVSPSLSYLHSHTRTSELTVGS